MAASLKYGLPAQEPSGYIAALTGELTALRAKVGISQGELACLIGFCRQSYAAVETGKKPMSQPMYLALILFFDYNQATHQMLRDLRVFPTDLVRRFNNGDAYMPPEGLFGGSGLVGDIARMVRALDAQGIWALKTALHLEYDRCIEAGGNTTL